MSATSSLEWRTLRLRMSLPEMPWGPFMMGIDWPEQHQLEREFLKKVVDLSTLRRFDAGRQLSVET